MISELQYKTLIMEQVSRLNVISASQIALNIMSLTNPHLFKKEEFDSALEGLIASGYLISVYFTSAKGESRELFFPKGTTFSFTNQHRVRPRSEERNEWREKYGYNPEDI